MVKFLLLQQSHGVEQQFVQFPIKSIENALTYFISSHKPLNNFYCGNSKIFILVKEIMKGKCKFNHRLQQNHDVLKVPAAAILK